MDAFTTVRHIRKATTILEILVLEANAIRTSPEQDHAIIGAALYRRFELSIK